MHNRMPLQPYIIFRVPAESVQHSAYKWSSLRCNVASSHRSPNKWGGRAFLLTQIFLPAFAAARVGEGGRQHHVLLAVTSSSCRYPPSSSFFWPLSSLLLQFSTCLCGSQSRGRGKTTPCASCLSFFKLQVSSPRPPDSHFSLLLFPVRS